MTVNRGFTLVEILVVIGIIAVLLALIFPVLSMVREKMRQGTCLSNQRQLAMNFSMDAQGSEERLPTADVVWTLPNLNRKILICPVKSHLPNGYAFNGALCGVSISSCKYPSGTIVTGDASDAAVANGNIANSSDEYDPRHGGKAIVSYLDGHAKLLGDE